MTGLIGRVLVNRGGAMVPEKGKFPRFVEVEPFEVVRTMDSDRDDCCE